MKALGNKEFVDDFLRGQMDCERGIPHQSGQGKAYDRGYATQYELEQRQTEMSLRGERNGTYRSRHGE